MDGKNFGAVWVPPSRFIHVGQRFQRYGHNLICLERPADLWPPRRACRGCFFKNSFASENVIMNCKDVQCSAFDRADGKNVWFVDCGEIDNNQQSK